ncbi:hypothetical protein MTR_1g108750 [Medicago truncatula]|uniref:KIB1-4 beta-propeller domain-containing protein n=1 Tax=Medicago truncatula TaxID=3880 RepID=G7IAW0_MEDTR|nr:hypothetical protein MTR_1g108750 [Medicago truncatula]
MERDWVNLGAIPLGLVLDMLEEHIDHVWFGAVCKSWRSIAKLNHQDQHIAHANDGEELVVWHSKRETVCGSSHGWLALVDYSKSTLTLMNPFKDIPPIILPPINWVYKVTLSADLITSPNDYVV